MENKKEIRSKFIKGTSYEFNIAKIESFWFMGNAGNSHEANFKLIIRNNDNGIYEAYYPESIFYRIKELSDIQDILKETEGLKTKTLFFKFEEAEREIILLNQKELESSSYDDLIFLESQLSEEQKENLEFWIKHVFESNENIDKYILEDLNNLFYCEGFESSDEYHLKLTADDSTFLKIAKKALKLLKINVDEGFFIKFRKSTSSTFTFTQLKAKNALTAIEDDKFINGNQQGINFESLENEFIYDTLDFDSLVDGIYSMHEYQISEEDHIVEIYENRHKINSSKMRKELNYTIKKTQNSNV